tara:strand:+ start:436 stop:687 length:252 start_codon:yes stop_codon:yes gene_type:complete
MSFLICPNFLISNNLLSQESYNLNEIEINKSTNLEEDDNLDFLSNPFEIVDMIRRANSLNDATKPSDALDEAIKSFDMIRDDE